MTVGDSIAGSAQDTRRLKNVGGDSAEIQIFKIIKENLEVQEHSTIISSRNIAGTAGIYGHEKYGIYGISRYGELSVVGGIW